MDQKLYDLLLEQGMSEEFAASTAAKYATKIPTSFGDWIDNAVNEGGIRRRLELVGVCLLLLKVQPSEQLLKVAKSYGDVNTKEVLRRLSELTASKLIPQKDVKGRLQKFANELDNIPDTVEQEEEYPQLDENDALLQAARSALEAQKAKAEQQAVEIESPPEENNDVEEEEENEPVKTFLGKPEAPSFPPL